MRNVQTVFFFTVDGEREEGGCDFTEWTPYGPCSVTCGVGQRARVRSVRGITDAVDDLKCTGNLTQVERCDAGPCTGQSNAQDDECSGSPLGFELATGHRKRRKHCIYILGQEINFFAKVLNGYFLFPTHRVM